MDNDLDKKRRRFRYRGSLVGPIILITIGVVFLLSNMGYLSGDVWNFILRLWPLILVAIGLDNVLQGRGVTGPLLFIGLGIIILLNNLGLTDWNIWDLLLRLWPVILIAIGLDIVLARRSIWGALLAVGILVVILIVAIWYFGPGQGGVAGERNEIVQSLNGANQADIILKPVVAGINIESLSSAENLLEGSIHQWRGESVQREYEVVDGTGKFLLSGEGINSFQSTRLNEAGWDLDITDSIPITLDFGLGLGQVEADLRSLKINEFIIKVAVGRIVIDLPDGHPASGEIENPIGSIQINVPANTGLRLIAETGLTSIQLPPNYDVEGDVYTSPGFSAAEYQVELVINQAIGLVKVEETVDQ
jgi:Domain of unknown function (DUF5668)